VPAVAVIVGSLLAGALYAWFSGEDVNWDWRNYHEYGAFALLNGRFDVDVMPGGFQSFLNPLVYVPAYLLRHGLGAPSWGLVLGAIHGLNLALVWWISRLLLGASRSGWAVLASVVIAAFGPMTLSEVGTSFADILTALPVLTGLGLILSADERHVVRFVTAGLLIGAAVGLKLTNATFLIGAATALLAFKHPVRKIGAFALGSSTGGLATGGTWALMLWRQFGSPVFPFFNNIFRSPEAPIASLADGRFLPHGVLDAVAYPFYWLIGDHRSSEFAFRDPRFAVVIALVAITIGAGILRNAQMIFRQRDNEFTLFFIVSYGSWLGMFAIHRYAIVLELMTAPMIVLFLTRLFETAYGPDASRTLMVRDMSAAIAALAVALWTRPADWSRRPWSDPYQPRLAGALSTPATFMLLEKPVGYVVPLLAVGSRAYQLADIVLPILPGAVLDQPGGTLDRRIRHGLAHPLEGGVRALFLDGSSPRSELLAPYDLEIDGSCACEHIPGADNRDVVACPLVRKPQGPREHHS
jgi:glycosyl transferase family 87